MSSLDSLHDNLKVLQQFCIRVGKQPYIRDGTKNTFTSTEWPLKPDNWLTFSEALEALQKGVKVWHDGGYHPVDGIGFLVARNGHEGPQTLGGDLDCCRDPETGLISSWAVAFLQKVKPFYTEVSISKCGLRFFAYGRLPGERDNITGNGPQDDLPEESRERILTAKPKVREKLQKGDLAFNGLELYESGRHLTLTGQKVEELCFPKEDQTGSIAEALKPFLLVESVKETAKAYKKSGSLPQIKILDVIDTTGFTQSGGQLLGPHPTKGSTTGQNLVVDPGAGIWAYMHNKASKSAPGGDAWAWLACECGAVAWEDAGKGVLRDRDVVEKTLKHAVSRGLITEAEAKYNPPPMERGEALLLVADLKENVTDDPGLPFEAKYIEALAVIKKHNQAEYERILAFLKGKASVRDLKKKVADKAFEISQQAKQAEEAAKKAVPVDIKQAAKEIIDRGEAYEHIYRVWQKRVKGNQWLGKGLLISRGVQSCRNTKGIHVYAHGKFGHGKSEGMERMAELVPSEYIMDEDVSPLAVHYASEEGFLLPGTTLLIDEMAWTDPLGSMCKRITTRFQKGSTHLTVIDGKPRRFKTKERISIWTNSADLQADEQLRDRFFDAPVDENQTEDIIAFQKIRDTLPDAPEEAARETAICQEILRDLAGRLFMVKIPFAERIKFPASEGTRGYNIFSDLVKGLAAMRYAKRETDEKGQLLATEADFNDAKAVYEGVKGHSEERYGTAETRILQAIIDNGRTALIKDIKRLTGLSEGRIKDIINGRGKDEQKRHGLLYKCPQLEANRVDLSTVVTTDKYGNAVDRRTTHPTEYSLPDNFRLSNGEGELISLDPDVPDVDPDVDSDVPNINNSKDTDVKDVVKEEREEDIINGLSGKGLEDSKNKSPSLGEKCYVNTSGCQLIAEEGDVAQNEPYVGYVAMAGDSEKHYVGISPKTGKIDKPTPTKKPGSYSEMVALVPPDRSSPEAEAICRAFRGLLMRGIAPRVDFLIKETGLPGDVIQAYLNGAPWLRKDDSSPAGIVVYLPSEASA